MILSNWIIKMRNQLANFASECDSAAAIEDTRMSLAEREQLQKKLKDIVNLIDKKIFKK